MGDYRSEPLEKYVDDLAARLIRELKGFCQGVHIMPLGWGSKVPKVLEAAGL